MPLSYNQLMIEKKEYKVANLEIISTSAEVLLSGAMDEELFKRMSAVIDAEGPIKESLLFKRTINSFSLEKVGSRLLDLFLRIESTLPYRCTDDYGEKLFHNGNEESFFRPTPDAEIRYSYQIPTIEAANAIIYILSQSDSKPYKKDIAPLFLKEMEWLKMGARVNELFENALKDERIEKSKNGRYYLKN